MRGGLLFAGSHTTLVENVMVAVIVDSLSLGASTGIRLRSRVGFRVVVAWAVLCFLRADPSSLLEFSSSEFRALMLLLVSAAARALCGGWSCRLRRTSSHFLAVVSPVPRRVLQVRSSWAVAEGPARSSDRGSGTVRALVAVVSDLTVCARDAFAALVLLGALVAVLGLAGFLVSLRWLLFSALLVRGLLVSPGWLLASPGWLLLVHVREPARMHGALLSFGWRLLVRDKALSSATVSLTPLGSGISGPLFSEVRVFGAFVVVEAEANAIALVLAGVALGREV